MSTDAFDIKITRVCYKNHDLTVEYRKSVIDGNIVSTDNIVVEKPGFFRPHPDFERAFAKAGDILARHMELLYVRSRITPLELAVHESDKGIEYTITAELSCYRARGSAKIKTPKLSPGSVYFWDDPDNDPEERLDKLTVKELEDITQILLETTLYITAGKQGESPQPDFFDELEEDSADKESDADDITSYF